MAVTQSLSERPVLALVVPDLFHATQTFFHEHIARIWPSRTVVVHFSSTGPPALTDVPVLEVPLRATWPQTSVPGLRKLFGVANSIKTSRLTKRDEARITAFFEQHGVTHVFAEFANSAALVLPLTQRLNLPLTSLSHGWDINIVGQGRVWHRRYQKLFRSDAQLAAVCNFLRDRMLEIGAPADRVEIIPCAVDAASFPTVRHSREAARVVMVCRLIGQKGPLQAVRSFALAHAVQPELTLDVVGGGPLENELVAEIDRLQIKHAVRLHGSKDHQEALAVIASSHIFLQHCMALPGGGIESQAVSLLEAMGHGLVPIVTRHGGMPDHVLDGVRGWVVEEGDEAAMGQRIAQMNNDPAARAKIGAAARAYVLSNFNRETVYPKLRQTIGLPNVEGH